MGNYVISISREFGSGGRLIGKRLAAALGIPCYDRTIIQKTSEKSGLSPDFIARAEERARSRFHLSIAPVGIGTPALAHQGVPVSHQAFFAQAEVIRELADEGPCVIVGRCSDYVLGERPECLKVFIHAVPYPLGGHGAAGCSDGQGPGQLLQLLHRPHLGRHAPLRPDPELRRHRSGGGGGADCRAGEGPLCFGGAVI